jgi:hypothetical protein
MSAHAHTCQTDLDTTQAWPEEMDTQSQSSGISGRRLAHGKAYLTDLLSRRLSGCTVAPRLGAKEPYKGKKRLADSALSKTCHTRCQQDAAETRC